MNVSAPTSSRRAAVLVPIKSFDLAKSRLAHALDGAARASLARRMADTVLAAAAPLPVFVVCGDHEVADHVRARGARVIWNPPHGLNAAVGAGVDHLRRRGIDRVVVAHADLPFAAALAALADAEDDEVVVVPDRRDDGTNVLSIPTGTGFAFQYGVGSAAAHRAEAARCELAVRVVRDEQLAWDVDVPDDLGALDPSLPAEGTTTAAPPPASRPPGDHS